MALSAFHPAVRYLLKYSIWISFYFDLIIFRRSRTLRVYFLYGVPAATDQ